MQEILQVKDVRKTYGYGDAAINALDGVTFAMEKGDFVAVMGASGSGKSTLLNVISTIEPLSEGEIYVDGSPISALGEKQLAAFRRDKLGFIFQDYNLLDTLTAGENITLPLNLKKMGADKIKSELERVSRALGVGDQLDKFPHEMSGGQRQRAACARAVVTNPALILADEPTGALDSHNSRILMEQFVLMNESFGCSVLMVTHDAVMASYAKRALFLRDGKLYEELVRGDKDRKQFYGEIVALTAAGGGGDAV